MNKYSVAVLTYNREELLKRCLTSILEQAIKPNEIIVIDQNSKNLLKKTITQLQRDNKTVTIKYIHMKLRNVSKGRNMAIKIASNDFILFTDDDCEVEKNWGKNAVRALSTHQLVLGNCTINKKQKSILAYIQHTLTDSYFSLFRFQTSKSFFQSYILDTKNCAINKKKVLKQNVLFNPQQPYIEDMDFSYQAYTKNIPIRYESKMLIAHTYKDNIFDVLKSQFKLGHNFQILDKRWEKNVRIKALKAYMFTKHEKRNSEITTSYKYIYLLFFFFRKLGYLFGTMKTLFIGT